MMTTTIRNRNEMFGAPVDFTAVDEEAAVAEMQTTIRQCGPEFAEVVVTTDDYEIID